MTQHHRSIWFAALVTPWAVPIGLNLLALLFGLFTKGTGALTGRDDLYLVFGYTLPATYTAMLVIGLPYVLWLRAHGVLTFLPVCIGAMIAAIVVSPAYVEILFHSTSLHAGDILIYALFGLLSGIVFCLAAGITFRPSGRAKKPRAA
ncbi:hypothetical protein [Rhodanobacter glycinis]|jgi:hypothetical protein|uniref:hypothetical protein n=1 Tax=Rhodanobacter glycinis TaxID=582702 RepID=UPI0011143B95|nr:hypothetical protein [Rhodanobacter glycinis]